MLCPITDNIQKVLLKKDLIEIKSGKYYAKKDSIEELDLVLNQINKEYKSKYNLDNITIRDKDTNEVLIDENKINYAQFIKNHINPVNLSQLMPTKYINLAKYTMPPFDISMDGFENWMRQEIIDAGLEDLTPDIINLATFLGTKINEAIASPTPFRTLFKIVGVTNPALYMIADYFDKKEIGLLVNMTVEKRKLLSDDIPIGIRGGVLSQRQFPHLNIPTQFILFLSPLIIAYSHVESTKRKEFSLNSYKEDPFDLFRQVLMHELIHGIMVTGFSSNPKENERIQQEYNDYFDEELKPRIKEIVEDAGKVIYDEALIGTLKYMLNYRSHPEEIIAFLTSKAVVNYLNSIESPTGNTFPFDPNNFWSIFLLNSLENKNLNEKSLLAYLLAGLSHIKFTREELKKAEKTYYEQGGFFNQSFSPLQLGPLYPDENRSPNSPRKIYTEQDLYNTVVGVNRENLLSHYNIKEEDIPSVLNNANKLEEILNKAIKSDTPFKTLFELVGVTNLALFKIAEYFDKQSVGVLINSFGKDNFAGRLETAKEEYSNFLFKLWLNPLILGVASFYYGNDRNITMEEQLKLTVFHEVIHAIIFSGFKAKDGSLTIQEINYFLKETQDLIKPFIFDNPSNKEKFDQLPKTVQIQLLYALSLTPPIYPQEVITVLLTDKDVINFLNSVPTQTTYEFPENSFWSLILLSAGIDKNNYNPNSLFGWIINRFNNNLLIPTVEELQEVNQIYRNQGGFFNQEFTPENNKDFNNFNKDSDYRTIKQASVINNILNNAINSSTPFQELFKSLNVTNPLLFDLAIWAENQGLKLFNYTEDDANRTAIASFMPFSGIHFNPFNAAQAYIEFYSNSNISLEDFLRMIVFHELTHAVLYHGFYDHNDPAKQKVLFNLWKVVLKQYNKNLDKFAELSEFGKGSLSYMLDNLNPSQHEIITFLLTDPEMQKYLLSINYGEAKADVIDNSIWSLILLNSRIDKASIKDNTLFTFIINELNKLQTIDTELNNIVDKYKKAGGFPTQDLKIKNTSNIISSKILFEKENKNKSYDFNNKINLAKDTQLLTKEDYKKVQTPENAKNLRENYLEKEGEINYEINDEKEIARINKILDEASAWIQNKNMYLVLSQLNQDLDTQNRKQATILVKHNGITIAELNMGYGKSPFHDLNSTSIEDIGIYYTELQRAGLYIGTALYIAAYEIGKKAPLTSSYDSHLAETSILAIVTRKRLEELGLIKNKLKGLDDYNNLGNSLNQDQAYIFSGGRKINLNFADRDYSKERYEIYKNLKSNNDQVETELVDYLELDESTNRIYKVNDPEESIKPVIDVREVLNEAAEMSNEVDIITLHEHSRLTKINDRGQVREEDSPNTFSINSRIQINVVLNEEDENTTESIEEIQIDDETTKVRLADMTKQENIFPGNHEVFAPMGGLLFRVDMANKVITILDVDAVNDVIIDSEYAGNLDQLAKDHYINLLVAIKELFPDYSLELDEDIINYAENFVEFIKNLPEGLTLNVTNVQQTKTGRTAEDIQRQITELEQRILNRDSNTTTSSENRQTINNTLENKNKSSLGENVRNLYKELSNNNNKNSSVTRKLLEKHNLYISDKAAEKLVGKNQAPIAHDHQVPDIFHSNYAVFKNSKTKKTYLVKTIHNKEYESLAKLLLEEALISNNILNQGKRKVVGISIDQNKLHLLLEIDTNYDNELAETYSEYRNSQSFFDRPEQVYDFYKKIQDDFPYLTVTLKIFGQANTETNINRIDRNALRQYDQSDLEQTLVGNIYYEFTDDSGVRKIAVLGKHLLHNTLVDNETGKLIPLGWRINYYIDNINNKEGSSFTPNIELSNIKTKIPNAEKRKYITGTPGNKNIIESKDLNIRLPKESWADSKQDSDYFYNEYLNYLKALPKNIEENPTNFIFMDALTYLKSVLNSSLLEQRDDQLDFNTANLTENIIDDEITKDILLEAATMSELVDFLVMRENQLGYNNMYRISTHEIETENTDYLRLNEKDLNNEELVPAGENENEENTNNQDQSDFIRGETLQNTYTETGNIEYRIDKDTKTLRIVSIYNMLLANHPSEPGNLHKAQIDRVTSILIALKELYPGFTIEIRSDAAEYKNRKYIMHNQQGGLQRTADFIPLVDIVNKLSKLGLSLPLKNDNNNNNNFRGPESQFDSKNKLGPRANKLYSVVKDTPTESDLKNLLKQLKKENLFITQEDLNKIIAGSDNLNKPAKGGFSTVYINKKAGRVIKIKKLTTLPAKSIHVAAIVRRALIEERIHNEIFPDAKYKFLGIFEASDGSLQFVMEQEYTPNDYFRNIPAKYRIPNQNAQSYLKNEENIQKQILQEIIDTYPGLEFIKDSSGKINLTSLLYTGTDESGNKYQVIVADLHQLNVRRRKNGKLIVIDPQIQALPAYKRNNDAESIINNPPNLTFSNLNDSFEGYFSESSFLSEDFDPKNKLGKKANKLFSIIKKKLGQANYDNLIQDLKDEKLLITRKELAELIKDSDIEDFGEYSEVFINTKLNQVIKVKKLSILNVKKEDVTSKLRQALIQERVHNEIFPDAKYELLGIIQDNDGVYLVIKQEYTPLEYKDKIPDKYKVKNVSLIERYNQQLLPEKQLNLLNEIIETYPGLELIKDKKGEIVLDTLLYRGVDEQGKPFYAVVTDLYPDNTRRTAEGKLIVIDPIIYPIEFFSQYYPDVVFPKDLDKYNNIIKRPPNLTFNTDFGNIDDAYEDDNDPFYDDRDADYQDYLNQLKEKEEKGEEEYIFESFSFGQALEEENQEEENNEDYDDYYFDEDLDEFFSEKAFNFSNKENNKNNKDYILNNNLFSTKESLARSPEDAQDFYDMYKSARKQKDYEVIENTKDFIEQNKDNPNFNIGEIADVDNTSDLINDKNTREALNAAATMSADTDFLTAREINNNENTIKIEAWGIVTDADENLLLDINHLRSPDDFIKNNNSYFKRSEIVVNINKNSRLVTLVGIEGYAGYNSFSSIDENDESFNYGFDMFMPLFNFLKEKYPNYLIYLPNELISQWAIDPDTNQSELIDFLNNAADLGVSLNLFNNRNNRESRAENLSSTLNNDNLYNSVEENNKKFYKKHNKEEIIIPESEAQADAKIAKMQKLFEEKLNKKILIIKNKDLEVSGRLLSKENTPGNYFAAIEINPDKLFSDTVFHEFGHLYIELLGGIEDIRIQKAIEILRNTNLYDKVKAAYPELNEEDLDKEVLATALGIEGNKVFLKTSDFDNFSAHQSVWQKIKEFFLRLLAKIFNLNDNEFNLIQELASEMLSATKIKLDSTMEFNNSLDRNAKYKVKEATQEEADKLFEELSNRFTIDEDTHTYIDNEDIESFKPGESVTTYARNMSNVGKSNRFGDWDIPMSKFKELNKSNYKRILLEAGMPKALDDALNDYFHNNLSGKSPGITLDKDVYWYTWYSDLVNSKQDPGTELVLRSLEAEILENFDVINKAAYENQKNNERPAKAGKTIHKAIQAYIDGEIKDFSEYNIADTDEGLLLKQIKSIIDKGLAEGSKFYTEQILFAEVPKIAGTADLIEITKDGKFRIYDFKTMSSFKYIYSKEKKIENLDMYKMFLQRAYLNQILIYSIILEEYGLKPADNAINFLAIEVDLKEFDDENSTASSIKITNVHKQNISSGDYRFAAEIAKARGTILATIRNPEKLNELNLKSAAQKVEELGEILLRQINDYLKLTDNTRGKFPNNPVYDQRKIKELEKNLKAYINKNNKLMILTFVKNIHEAMLVVYNNAVDRESQLTAEYIMNLEFLIQLANSIDDIEAMLLDGTFSTEFNLTKDDADELRELVNNTKSSMTSVIELAKRRTRDLAVRTLARNSNYQEGIMKEKFEIEGAKDLKLKGKELDKYIQDKLIENKDDIEAAEFLYWKNIMESGYIDSRAFESLLADPGMNKSLLVQVTKNIIDKVDQATRVETDAAMQELVSWYKNLPTKYKTGSSEEVWSKFLQSASYIDLDGNKQTYKAPRLISKYTSEYKEHYLKYENKLDYLEREIEKAIRDNNKARVELIKEERERILKIREIELQGKSKASGMSSEYVALTDEEKKILEFLMLQIEKADSRLELNPNAKLIKGIPGSNGDLVYNIPKRRKESMEAAYDSNFNNNKIKNFFSNISSRIKDLVRPPKDEEELNLTQYENNNSLNTQNTDLLGNVIYDVPVFFRNQLEDPVLQSFDLPSLLALNHETTIMYRNYKYIEADLWMIMNAINPTKHGKAVHQTDTLINKKIKSSIKNQADRIVRSTNENTLKAVRDSVLNRFYKRAYKGVYSSQNYKAIKAGEALNKYTSMVLLSGNFRSAAMTSIQASIYRSVEAMSGEHFGRKEAILGTKKLTADLPNIIKDSQNNFPESKTILLIRMFGLETQYSALTNKFYKNNFFKKNLDSGAIFVLTQIAEMAATGSLMYSLLSNIKVMDTDGDYINIKGEKVNNREAAMSLDEAYELDSTTNKLILNPKVVYTEHNPIKPYQENTDINTVAATEISRYIRDTYANLYGQYNQELKSSLEMYVIGKLVMSMRKWIPRGMHRRWRGISSAGMKYQDLRKDENLEKRFYSQDQKAFHEGFYTTGIRFGINLVKEMRTSGLSFAMSRKKLYGELTRHEKANLTRLASEMAIIVLTFVASLFARLLVANLDDEDKKKDAIYFSAYLMERIRQESATFIDPFELWEILKTPAASVSVINRLGNLVGQLVGISYNSDYNSFDFTYNDLYERGPRKDRYKIEKHIQGLIPMYKNAEQLKGILGWDSKESIEETFKFAIQ